MTKIQHTPPVDPEIRALADLSEKISAGDKLDADVLAHALYQAALQGHHELAERFLAAGADATAFARFYVVTRQLQNEYTAVSCAIGNNDSKMISLFSKYGVDFYKPVFLRKNTAIFRANNPMHSALRGKKTAAAHALLDAGFDILHPSLGLEKRPSDFLPTFALETKNDDIALRMIDQLQDARYLHDYSLLAKAAESEFCNGITTILEKARLLGHPLDINEISYAAVCAASKGNTDALGVLLDAGADPNIFCTYNDSVTKNLQLLETALHSAIVAAKPDADKKKDTVRLLLQYGADPKIKTLYHTPQDAIEIAQQKFSYLLPLLSQAKALRENFLLAQVQPAIDRIYRGGDKPLPLPIRRVKP